jgi:hypothetical protein
MKIFVINMARATERRTILRHLDELGLEAEIPPAVEGAKIERSTLGPDAEPGLSAGEIGCYLSHIRFWQIVVERELEHAIVLEDDVICDPAMMTVAEEIASLKLPVDAVRLSALQPIRGRTIARLSGGHSLLLPNKNPSGTQGYMVSLQGPATCCRCCRCPSSPSTTPSTLTGNTVFAYPSFPQPRRRRRQHRQHHRRPLRQHHALEPASSPDPRRRSPKTEDHVYLMALRLKSRLHNARDSQTVAR